jgi:hypothetical protein
MEEESACRTSRPPRKCPWKSSVGVVFQRVSHSILLLIFPHLRVLLARNVLKAQVLGVEIARPAEERCGMPGPEADALVLLAACQERATPPPDLLRFCLQTS